MPIKARLTKKGGPTPNALSIRDFSTCIKDDDLIEVDTVGDH